MKRPLLLSFTFLLLLRAGAQVSPTGYLKANAFLLDSSGHEPAASTHADPLDREYKVFFTGESHALGSDAVISTFMTRYLYQKHHLRTVIMELPVSNEPFINAYILRGKKDSLNMLKTFLGFNKAFRHDMEFLYSFNKAQRNDSDKIRVCTIDVEQEYKNPLRVLASLLPAGTPPSKIESAIQLLKTMIAAKGKMDNTLLQKNFSEISLDIERCHASYLSYFENKMGLFEKLVTATTIGANYEIEKFITVTTVQSHISDSIFMNQREAFLYRNVTELLITHPGQCLYGQFGKAHISLRQNDSDEYSRDWNCLATRLNYWTGSPVKGKVCSIDIVYPGSGFYSGPEYDEHFMSALQEYTNGFNFPGIFLFRVSDPACPWPILTEKFRFVITYRH